MNLATKSIFCPEVMAVPLEPDTVAARVTVVEEGFLLCAIGYREASYWNLCVH